MSSVRRIVHMRHALDARDVLQLEQRLVAIEEIAARVELQALVIGKSGDSAGQRTIRKADNAGERGCLVGEEGFEDGVAGYA